MKKRKINGAKLSMEDKMEIAEMVITELEARVGRTVIRRIVLTVGLAVTALTTFILAKVFNN